MRDECRCSFWASVSTLNAELRDGSGLNDGCEVSSFIVRNLAGSSLWLPNCPTSPQCPNKRQCAIHHSKKPREPLFPGASVANKEPEHRRE